MLPPRRRLMLSSGKYCVDGFDHVRRKSINKFGRFHVLVNLLDATSTRDDRAHPGILQAPRKRKLRQRRAHLLREWFQRGNFGEPVSISDLIPQPGQTL